MILVASKTGSVVHIPHGLSYKFFKKERFMKLIYLILWLAFAVGVGEVLIDLTNELRGAAIEAHRRGPISHKLFTEQLTGQK